MIAYRTAAVYRQSGNVEAFPVFPGRLPDGQDRGPARNSVGAALMRAEHNYVTEEKPR